MSKFYDENEIAKAVKLLKPGRELFEVRILADKGTYSGYFRGSDALISALHGISDNILCGANIYFTLNEVNEACYCRRQRDTFLYSDKKTPTTSDSDITAYRFLFIDLDPVRPSATSSSDAELMAAGRKAAQVREYMLGEGWELPVVVLSGNGYHLLYRVDENDFASEDEYKQLLEKLADRFNDDIVKIDTVNHNPARICKLPGTLAQKGGNFPERPHRMSRIVSEGGEHAPED